MTNTKMKDEAGGQPPADAAAVRAAPAREPVKKAASAFRTISEVADELDVQQHVLRFWETKFSQIKPLKRGGGRRYYRPEDVALLKKIHHLLYTEGYTIKGVQKLLRGGAVEKPAAAAPSPAPKQQAVRKDEPPMSPRQRAILESMLGDLKELRDLIKGE